MSTLPAEAPPDFSARISRLFVYPVKSCAGVEMAEAVLTDAGLDLDRAWMVVDADDGGFVTQRELPRMALIRPQLRHFEMVLRAPGMLALHVQIDAVESPIAVRLWKDKFNAFDMGDVAAQWFTDFLGMDADGRRLPGARRLRLVRFDPNHRRLSNMQWTGGVEAPNQFSDGYPVLVLGEESLAGLNARLAAAGHAPVGIERFRPNIVLAGVDAHDEDRVGTLAVAADAPVRLQPVKPCPRCPIPNVDPATAVVTHAVGDALQGYRQDPRLNGAPSFGMNVIVLEGDGQSLRVGQAVTGAWQFD